MNVKLISISRDFEILQGGAPGVEYQCDETTTRVKEFEEGGIVETIETTFFGGGRSIVLSHRYTESAAPYGNGGLGAARLSRRPGARA